MKIFIRWTLAFTLVAVWSLTGFAQFIGGSWGQTVVLAVQADGSCRATNIMTTSRSVMEQQIHFMERFRDEGLAIQRPAVATNAVAKPLTDAELIQKIKAMKEEGDGMLGTEPDENLVVSVTNDVVRMEGTRSFASIEKMLIERSQYEDQFVRFTNTRFEQDANGQLRITFTPATTPPHLKSLRSSAKLAGAKGAFRLVLPGKILTSGFPETEGRTTGFSFDATKDESFDAAIKLYAGPVVVTAEPGGLKVPQPIESRNLRRASTRNREVGGDLPVTDAGPGFLAEAQMIITRTLHVFPGGADHFGKDEYLSRQLGTTISAKLFAPKGRTLQSVTDVRVLKATDDRGRGIKPADEEEMSSYSTQSEDASSAPIELRLDLPLADAAAIDELEAEAVALTAGAWKQMTLTNLQGTVSNEVDLAAVLPGAKLVITKFTGKERQARIEAQVKGPATVRRLSFSARIPGTTEANSYVNERRFSTRDGVATRTVDIMLSSYGDDQESGMPPVLVVRFPEDLRRERVKFKLTGLDLL